MARIWLWLGRLKPGKEAQRGIMWGLVGLTLLAAALAGYGLQSGFGTALDTLLGLGVGLVGLAVSLLLTWALLAVLRPLPWWGVGAGIAAAVAFAYFLDMDLEAAYPIWLTGLALAILLGWSGGQVFAKKRRWLWPVLILGAAGQVAFIYAFAHPGTKEHLLNLDLPEPVGFHLDLPDPGQPGAYPVQTLTYGSGTDYYRPEFAAEADWLTEPIAIGQFMGLTEGIEKESREWFWGFDTAAFPRNGRVWYPVGTGPFPLVLMMHGNHNMTDFSDTGYAYLGEHLASHGYIFVSVDANFFNGYLTGAVGGENDARAWMLLKHLELWQDWNGEVGNPLAGKVDMEHIALIGHSRGGEAVAIAAAFNHLAHYPDNANIRLGFNYGIRAIVAIAPTDEQYRPTGQPLPLEDVNYLVLQGSHDSDVATYNGLRQYQRITFSGEGDWFKAGLYIYRANHGQFNTVWGATDFGWPRRLYLNTEALLRGEEQRQIARVMITAFLNVTLRGQAEYRPVVQDWRYAAAWLPPTYFINQYEDTHFRLLADFEEDVDVTTTTLAGGTSEGWGLSTWREEALTFRNGNAQENQAVRLGWGGSSSWYEITLPEGFASDLTGNDELIFAAAATTTRPDLLDFSLVLTDGAGTAVSLPLSQFALLLPQLPVEHTRWPLYEADRYKNGSEAVLQTFRLRLGAFAAADPTFNPATLQTIRFHFNQSQSGEIYLDRLGFYTP
ncbi:MAG: MFS transporter [Chloroflexi bacterium]|nr:MFS transporter [Chloroflexota bacterium]MBP8059954.1 MFS transporter [Chloroflexota bacterium]